MGLYEKFHSEIIPPIFLVFFTGTVQLLTLAGRQDPITLRAVLENSLGSTDAYCLLFFFFLWAFLSLKVPSNKVTGQATATGFVPEFKANGILYFWVTLAVFGIIFTFYPNYAIVVFYNVPEIFGAINILALLFCGWLLFKAKLYPEQDVRDNPTSPGSLVFDYYRGVELHPNVLGVSVKQLVVSRLGIMGWQLLCLIYFITGTLMFGFNFAFFVSVFIQLAYTLKFYLYESSGYWHSLDIAFDRAGYYLIWGCLVWMPLFFAFHSYYFVFNPPINSPVISTLCLIIGVAAVVLGYRADYEKYYIRTAKSHSVQLYGKQADIILAEYIDIHGKKQKSRLLVSGFWGQARHFNYFFEFLTYLAWSVPGYSVGIVPFLCPIFMVVLMYHRLYRDEVKCSKKYGKHWELYCSRVPYKIIPWVY